MNARRILAVPVLMGISLMLLAGCMEDRRADIPSNAIQASSGNSKLTYTPSQDGTVWVFDKTNNRIDYSGPVMAGAAVTVDPDSNVVTVNGRTVMNGSLARGADHTVFFMPSTPDLHTTY